MIQNTLPTISLRRLSSESGYHYSYLLLISVVGAALISMGLAYVLVYISPAFAIVGALAIPAGILLVTRPELGLLLIVFFIPLEDFNKFGAISILKLLSVAVFGMATIHFFIFRRKDSLVSAPQNWLIIVFLGAVILSNFVAINPSRTLEKTFKLLRILTLYLVVINVIRTERDLKRLLWVFVIGGFLSTVYGLVNPEQVGNDRFSGTMGHPNALAVTLVARLPLTFSLLKIEKDRLKQIFLLVMVGVMVYGITLTGSRGGLLAMGLALIAFILLQKKKVIWLILIMVITLGGLIVMPTKMKMRVGLIEASADENLGNSTDRRESYQIFGWQHWQQYPILGIGFDGFSEAYAFSEYRFLQTSTKKRVAHNTYLEILVGTGIVGFTPFILLLALSLFVVLKCAKHGDRSPDLANLSVGLFAGQAGFFLGILFLSKQYDKTLWLFIATVVVVQHLINSAKHQ